MNIWLVEPYYIGSHQAWADGYRTHSRHHRSERIVHFGYAEDGATYGSLLWQADVVVSTALHEFFGAAIVEACYCGCYPILPCRLSYPELIHDEHHAACLYDDSEALLSRLRKAINQIERIRSFSLQQHVARFDWSQMVSRYDDLLEDMVAHRDPATMGKASLP
jgi:glycosyltransferase involved in cell wall biosynthesis